MQKLLLTAYRKSYITKSIGNKMNDLDLCLEVVSRSWQPLSYIRRWISRKTLEIETSKWPRIGLAYRGNQMVTWPITAYAYLSNRETPSHHGRLVSLLGVHGMLSSSRVAACGVLCWPQALISVPLGPFVMSLAIRSLCSICWTRVRSAFRQHFL